MQSEEFGRAALARFPDIWNVLTLDALEAWLQTQPSTARYNGWNDQACPVARYLRDHYQLPAWQVSVHATGIGLGGAWLDDVPRDIARLVVDLSVRPKERLGPRSALRCVAAVRADGNVKTRTEAN